eukprot:9576525-Ditylum_brightwellii.AAC.1
MEFPPPGNFKWIKKVSTQAPSCSKNLWKPVYTTKSVNQKHLRKQVQLIRATLREEGSTRGHHYCKYHGYCNHTTDECRITMNWCKGSTLHEREDRSCKSKKVHFSSDKAKSCDTLSDGNKDPHVIIDKKIAAALSHQEKKDLNKFEALSILSGSDNDNNSNNDSRVSNASNEEMNSE